MVNTTISQVSICIHTSIEDWCGAVIAVIAVIACKPSYQLCNAVASKPELESLTKLERYEGKTAQDVLTMMISSLSSNMLPNDWTDQGLGSVSDRKTENKVSLSPHTQSDMH